MADLIAGEYYLSGMREMASGWLMREDSTFEFFFTYGALDRYGSGTWKESNGVVGFKTKPKPPLDYAMVKSAVKKSGSISIRIKDNNEAILRYVYVSLKNGEEGTWEKMDQSGEIKLPYQPVKTISLFFEFCPERFSTLAISDPASDDFEFRFEPWLFEVFFEGFSLNSKDGELFGKHPLMEGDQFQYIKSA